MSNFQTIHDMSSSWNIHWKFIFTKKRMENWKYTHVFHWQPVLNLWQELRQSKGVWRSLEKYPLYRVNLSKNGENCPTFRNRDLFHPQKLKTDLKKHTGCLKCKKYFFQNSFETYLLWLIFHDVPIRIHLWFLELYLGVALSNN